MINTNLEIFASINETSYPETQVEILMDTLISNFFGLESSIYLYSETSNKVINYQTIYLIIYNLPVSLNPKTSVTLNIYLPIGFPTVLPEIYLQYKPNFVLNPKYSGLVLNPNTLQLNYHSLMTWSIGNTDFSKLFRQLKDMFNGVLPLIPAKAKKQDKGIIGLSNVNISSLRRVFVSFDSKDNEKNMEKNHNNNNNNIDLLPSQYLKKEKENKGKKFIDDFVIIDNMSLVKDDGNGNNKAINQNINNKADTLINNQTVDYYNQHKNVRDFSVKEYDPFQPIPKFFKRQINNTVFTDEDVNNVLLNEIESRLPDILFVQLNEVLFLKNQLLDAKEYFSKKTQYDKDMNQTFLLLSDFDRLNKKMNELSLSLNKKGDSDFNILPQNEIDFNDLNTLVTVYSPKSIKGRCMEWTIEDFLLILKKETIKGRIPFLEAVQYMRKYSRELFYIKHVNQLNFKEGS